jgi:3-deoxy-7-phosphoheptulonate synthase
VELGLPVSTEALDPITPQYLQDLISWSAIGARTTESQTHREMASGLSSAVGFKNGTDGGLTVAVNALRRPRDRTVSSESTARARCPYSRPAAIGYGHVVLRGGSAGPNYDSVHVRCASSALAEAGCPRTSWLTAATPTRTRIRPCSHWWRTDAADQIITGNRSIVGLMIESNIEAG